MIVMHHIRRDVSVEDRLKATVPRGGGVDVAAAAGLWARGGYEKVAEVDGDLDRAFAATQNGVMSDSWSRMPPCGVRPVPPCYVEVDGERYGRKSSEVGDIMEEDGVLRVVDMLGFTELPAAGRK